MFGFSSKDPKQTEKDNEVQDSIVFKPHRLYPVEHGTHEKFLAQDYSTPEDTSSEHSSDGVPVMPMPGPMPSIYDKGKVKDKMNIEWKIEDCKVHLFCKTASDGEGTLDHECGITSFYTTFAEQQNRQYFTPADWDACAKKTIEHNCKKREADKEAAKAPKQKTETPKENQKATAQQITQEQTSASDTSAKPDNTPATRAHRDSSISMTDVPEHMSLGQILPPREEKKVNTMDSDGNAPILMVSQESEGGVRLSYPLPVPTTAESTGMWEAVDGNAVRCDMIAEDDEEALAGANDAKPIVVATNDAADQDKKSVATNGDKADDKIDAQEIHDDKPTTTRGEVFPAYDDDLAMSLLEAENESNEASGSVPLNAEETKNGSSDSPPKSG
ncbi:hypothetical protein B7463_g1221, partial [Scytalidium lignicola]